MCAHYAPSTPFLSIQRLIARQRHDLRNDKARHSGYANVQRSRCVGDGAHPHHVAVVAGAARHNGKNSATWRAGYSYTFDNRVFLQGFYEHVRGEFNISAFGVLVGKKFAHGWQAGIGAGVEAKLMSSESFSLPTTRLAHGIADPNNTIGTMKFKSGNVSTGPSLGYSRPLNRVYSIGASLAFESNVSENEPSVSVDVSLGWSFQERASCGLVRTLPRSSQFR